MRLTSSHKMESFRLTLAASAFCLSIFGVNAQVRVNTVAGGYVGDGKTATSAALQSPQYAAMDRTGNLYIADYLNHRIRRVSASGIISTAAGTGIAGFSGDSGSAKAAKINMPTGIGIDAAKNIVFSDSANNRIRKISSAGVITTIAGTGVAGYSGDGGLATAAMISKPYGLALDANGNLFFSDLGNQRIRKIDTSGVITTVAGTGIAGFSGDGGPATSAQLNGATGLAAGNGGVLYIADTENLRVRKVNAAGMISTFAGSGLGGCVGDGGPATDARMGKLRGLLINRGRLLISNAGCDFIRSVDLTTNIITTIAGSTTSIGTGGFDGNGHTALSSVFLGPTGMVSDKAGNLVIVDTGNDQVRKVDSTTQIVTAIAGSFVGDGASGTGANLNAPSSMGFDSLGNLYVAESFGHRIRQLSSSGVITTFAGTGVTGSSGDGGPAVSATLAWPQAVAAGNNGDVFIADIFGQVIRKVDASGIISTLVPFNSDFFFIVALAADPQGNLYAADLGACVVWEITPAGAYSIVAGVTGLCGYNADGISAKAAFLNAPDGVAIRNGSLYIADGSNNRIRKVNTSGIISTVAGNGTCGFTGDGGPATAAELCLPGGIGFDAQNNLYISDFFNFRVRRVASSGKINTFAGTGQVGYNGEGLLATKTNLDSPIDVKVSPSGIVYVEDVFQSRVREIH